MKRNCIIKKINLFFISLLLSAALFAQTISKKEAVIHQAVEHLFAALTNTDTAAIKRSCTDDVRFYEYGQIWTIDTLIQKVMQNKSISDFKRTNSFEFVSTAINQQTAWVTYYLQSTFIRNGKEDLVKWMETVVLQKQNKIWKIKLLHSTRLAVK